VQSGSGIQMGFSLIFNTMACFIVPLTQAFVTTAIRRGMSKKETTLGSSIVRHLPLLEAMLYGGSAMLVVDHIASGELSIVYPFFTALSMAGSDAIWHEVLSVGLPMSIVVTVLWSVIVAIRAHRVQSSRL